MRMFRHPRDRLERAIDLIQRNIFRFPCERCSGGLVKTGATKLELESASAKNIPPGLSRRPALISCTASATPPKVLPDEKMPPSGSVCPPPAFREVEKKVGEPKK